MKKRRWDKVLGKKFEATRSFLNCVWLQWYVHMYSGLTEKLMGISFVVIQLLHNFGTIMCVDNTALLKMIRTF